MIVIKKSLEYVRMAYSGLLLKLPPLRWQHNKVMGTIMMLSKEKDIFNDNHKNK